MLIGKKPLPYQKGGKFEDGIAFIFSIFFVWKCFMNHKHKALWSLKNYKLYIYVH